MGELGINIVTLKKESDRSTTGHPLFVYGILRTHRSGTATRLDAAGVRRQPAVATARAPASGALQFTNVGPVSVRGQLILLPRERYEELLAILDAIETPDYKRVMTTVASDGRSTRAWVYQLATSGSQGALHKEEMLTAACRKALIAQYHLRCLRRFKGWVPADIFDSVPIPLQAHFEAILAAFFSTIDQVAGYFGKHDANGLFAAGPHSESIAPQLRTWYSEPIVAHARKMRNDTTHNYYGKRPGGDGLRVPRYPALWAEAPVDLLEYATAVMTHLDDLAGLIGCPVASTKAAGPG